MSQQDFTQIAIPTKVRRTVQVTVVAQPVEQCAICSYWLEWAPERRSPTFICVVCGNECCMGCAATERGVHPGQFPNRLICDNCHELPIDDQIKIAALTTEMNK